MRSTVYVFNGPNLNLLGQREPEIYGRDTLAEVEARCRALTDARGLTLDFRQTNAEHVMVDWLQEVRAGAVGHCAQSRGVHLRGLPDPRCHQDGRLPRDRGAHLEHSSP